MDQEPTTQTPVTPVSVNQSPQGSASSGPIKNPDNQLKNSGFNLKRWVVDHKVWAGVIAAGSVLVAAGSVFAYTKLHHKPKPAAKPAPVAAPAPPPPPILSPLTGLPVTQAVLNQPVFGVVIENSPEARPQSGLSQAGVVYETLAEGGITRFLAIFLDQQPTNLGPVRSLRPYFIDWAQEYSNPPVAHAGGSDQALAEVPQVGFKSMNGLNYGAYFRRAGDRAAPHNLYTSTASLIGLMQRNKWVTQATFASWKYKADSPMATPDHPNITATFSYANFTAKYTYVASCNCYNRFLAGVAHIDRNTGAQIQVKNVVAITVPTDFTGDAKGHVLDATIGGGKAVVFRDGTAIPGTWKKDSREGRIRFLDAAGAEIPLNAGNTWVEAVAQTGNVTY